MLFNPDPRKQETQVYFSRKQKQDSPLPLEFNDNTLPLEFNDNTVQSIELRKHLGLSFDKKLDFDIPIDDKINKCNKITGIMKRLSL